jgi:hypothetical protein
MQEILDVLSRGWMDLLARPGGPYAFRFLLQPLMAALLALRDGIGDARTGRSPYFWAVLHDKGQRRARFAEALKATARVGALAIPIDAAYQLKVLGTFYPDEALAVALLLALVPYLLLRGPVDRIARRWLARSTSRHAAPGPPPRRRTT